MKLFRLVFLAAFTLLFASCTAKKEISATTTKAVLYEYYENDLSLQKMGFYAKFNDKNASDMANITHLKTLTGKENFIIQKIGEIGLVLLNLDTNQTINLDQKVKLQNSKGIKIYEVKPGFIQSMVFVASDGICTTWSKEKPLFARTVSNYYPFLNQNLRTPFASKIELILQKNKGALVGDFAIINRLFSDEKASYIDELTEQDEFKNSLTNDIIKQTRVLDFICEIK
ncbi:hypothetical protein [Campylobacter suis]|uniref:DUF8095 domain-containing protein n=1 Tax=Campylobacter suis TaxID=2790657 RepID=A0ABM8Q4Y0_9BACT|nr:hypothetical protein [Campylobacter suis]CAD7287897.1 hypothetical protein LMG8286_00990 [Campylobacter suis]